MVQITLIHGTWGRGIPLVAKHRMAHRAKWCRPGSAFRIDLDRALQRDGMHYDVNTFEWSGANSFLDRDAAARNLADRLLASGSTHRHVLIAHSHGGNLALRAAQIIADRGWPGPALSIVSIATPFIHIRHEENGREFKLIGAYLSACLAALWIHLRLFDAMDAPWMPLTLGLIFLKLALGGSLIFLLIFGYVSETISSWSERVAKAGHYREADRLADLLVLRGTEDEATMVLALGLIGVRLSDISGLLATLAFTLLFLLFAVLAAVSAVLTFAGLSFEGPWFHQLLSGGAPVRTLFDVASSVGAAMLAAMLLPGLFKSVFGRELLIGTAAVSVTANSAPNVSSKATIVTLDRGRQGETALLHSLYDHPDCASEIAKWLAAAERS